MTLRSVSRQEPELRPELKRAEFVKEGQMFLLSPVSTVGSTALYSFLGAFFYPSGSYQNTLWPDQMQKYQC